METQERVRQFITEEIGFDGGSDELTVDLPIIERQIVDSMGIYQIVLMLESEYGISILDEEMLPSNFGTLGAIDAFVSSKLGAASR